MTFELLEKHSYNAAYSPKQRIVELPAAARTEHTLIGFTQPNGDGDNTDVWSIDDVYIGPDVPELPRSVEIHFDRPVWDTNHFTFAPNAAIGEFCEKRSLVFSVEPGAGFAWFETNMLDLQAGAFIQFKLSASCDGVSLTPRTDLRLILEYFDLGDSGWTPLPISCSPTTSASCSVMHSTLGNTLYVTEYQQGWHRVSMPLTETVSGRRYRFRVQYGNKASFAITDVYVGSDCPLACSGHGDCVNGACVCDQGYAAHAERGCAAASGTQREFREAFSGPAASAERWLEVDVCKRSIQYKSFLAPPEGGFLRAPPFFTLGGNSLDAAAASAASCSPSLLTKSDGSPAAVATGSLAKAPWSDKTLGAARGSPWCRG